MTTIVTGAAGALGSAVVRFLLARGDTVVAIDREGSEKKLEALGKVTALAFDVGDREAWATAMRDVKDVTGAAFIAGSWAGGEPVGAGGDTWRKMMSVNADTVYASLEALLPGMKQRKAGSIVVVGARPVEQPWTAGTAAEYAASKSAVIALAQAAAAEALSANVRINAVLPSMIDTPMNRGGMPNADFSKWVKPESIAAVIGFLLSDAAADVSGAAIPVYGKA